MISQIFTIILLLLKSIGPLRKWYEEFTVWYVNQRVAEMHKENRDAIRKALEQQDQIDLERAMGNPNAGKPVDHIPGTEIVDALPTPPDDAGVR